MNPLTRRLASLRTLALVALTSLTAAVLLAQTPATQPTPKPPATLRLHLMDGSVLTGKINTASIDVDTQFGPLKVPVDSIRSLTPGLQSHPELLKKIEDLVNDLAADGFAEREKAHQALLKMGPEIKAELEKYLKTAEAEKQTRLQKIVEEFDQALEADEDAESPEWVRDDVIATTQFTIVGKIKNQSFDVTSAYGTLAVKLGDIRRAARDAAEAEEIRKTITVSGNLMQTRQFEASTIKLNKGDQVLITASGSITMSPWGNNMSSTPDGGANFGITQPGNIPGGALTAKIGNSGPVFKVGSKSTFTAQQAGVINFGLAIQADYSSYQFPGEYTVKIRVIRK